MGSCDHNKALLHHSLEDVVGEILVGIREVVDLLQRVFCPGRKTPPPHVFCGEELITLERLRSKALEDEQTLVALLSGTSFDAPDYGLNIEFTSNKEETALVETIVRLLTGLKLVYQVLDQVAAQEETSNQRPKAPIGLLSLRHYTDICALVEFSVCWSVLPVPGVLLPIHDRLRYTLPKAIAGRMPREALVWAAEMTSPCLLWLTVGQLLLLDRFRSILLPRHLADLYAVVLLYNYKNEHGQMVKELAQELGVYGTSCHVDAVTKARTYQQLLRFGTEAPIQLRRKVSRLLTQAAVRDLASIVFVFVDDDGASAVRLAEALIESLNTNADRDALTREMLRCLDKISVPKEDQPEVSQQTKFMVQTIWAMADGLTDDRFLSALTTQRLEAGTKRLLYRLFSLWMFPPPQSPLPLQIMLRRNAATGLNVVQVLLRIIAVETVLVSVAKARSKQILKAMLSTAENLDALAVGLIQAVSPNQFDASWIFRLQGDDVKMDCNTNTDVAGIAAGIERRSKALCEALKDSTAPILPFLFRTLLNFYLSTPKCSQQHFELVPMTMLPMICEEIPTDKLVSEDGSILSMLQIVLVRFIQHIGCGEKVLKEAPNKDRLRTEEVRLQVAIESFSKTSNIQMGRLSPHPKLSIFVDIEMLSGTTSILLALFTSMLELNLLMQKEEELQPISKLLSFIAEVKPIETRQNGVDLSELSEMASQTLALVHSRSAGSNSGSPTGCESTLAMATKDLHSLDPPLRARSIVILRNLANGAQIIEPGNHQSESASLLLQIHRLLIEALSDRESYVFLAAIHSIVVVTEKWPSRLIPMLGLTHLSGDCNGKMLSKDQRLKLGEALVHIVRKKVGVLDELPGLLLSYVIGEKESNKTERKLSASQRLITHNTTDAFFLNANHDSSDETLKEREIRCRTGGPLFAVEEDFLVLSDRIHVVSELVAVLATSLIADVCHTLVDCAIDNLALETERLLRRAGANLAYELYCALNRDEDAHLATALAGSRHDVLVVSLERVVVGTEMQERLQDPATTARCQDTLRVLEENSERLLVGRLAFKEKQGLEQNPIARMIAPTIKVAPVLDHTGSNVLS